MRIRTDIAILLSTIICISQAACSHRAGETGKNDAGPAGLGWMLEKTFYPDTPETNQNFGKLVAMDDDTLAIVEGKITSTTDCSDKVHLWTRSSSGSWERDAEFHHDMGLPWSCSVKDIALDEDMLALSMEAGSPTDRTDLVRIFVWDDAGQPQVHDIYAQSEFNELHFGESISLLSGRLLVSARRSIDDQHFERVVLVYEFEQSSWLLTAELTSVDANMESEFGRSLDQDEQTVVVGAFRQDSDVEESGALYVFEMGTDEEWEEPTILTHKVASNADWFGFQVRVQDDLIAVSSVGIDLGRDSTGTVFVFARSHDGWEPTEEIPSPSKGVKWFGDSLDMHKGVVAATGVAEDNRGTIQVVESLTETSDSVTLRPGENQDGDAYGMVISLSDECILVGIPGLHYEKMGAGTAQLYCRSS